MPLIKAGFSLNEASEMETDEVSAWLEAVEIDNNYHKMTLLEVAPFGGLQIKDGVRLLNSRVEGLERKNKVALGIYEQQKAPSKEAIEERKKMMAASKLKKIDKTK